MQDAEDQARARHEAALRLQASERARAAKEEARQKAKDDLNNADFEMKAALREQLGRDPNASDIAAAREADLENKLAESLCARLSRSHDR